MGMFDYIQCEYELPSCPQALIDRWGKSIGDIVFQTKDTPDQGMTSYTITSDGSLLVNRKEYEWTAPPPKAVEPSQPRWSDFGYNKVVREWTESCHHFNGAIVFYDSYSHAEKHSGDDYQHDAFADGWVEYKALFQNGQLIQISQSEHTLPVKYTQQEIDDRCLTRAEAIRENNERQQRSRHEHPTAEQRLIDSIDAIIIEDQPMFGIEDLAIKLSQIQKLINNYREKYDLWYKQP